MAAVLALGAPAEASAAVTYADSGAFSNASGACPLPATVLANDLLLLVVESENEPISLSTANGFVEVPNSPQFAGAATTNPASRLAVYWKRAVGGGADQAPVVANSGNHNTCQVHRFSGVVPAGNPWDPTPAGGNDAAANDTSGSIPGGTTTVPNTLVVLLTTSSFNGNSTAQCDLWLNPNLSNLVERADQTSTTGLGGGHCMATGEKAAAGTFAATTLTLANTTFKGAMSLALSPDNSTAAGTVAAVESAGATPSIAVSAPYTNDPDGDNSLTYRYRTPVGSGVWSSGSVGHAASPYAFTIGSLTCGSTYEVEVTYVDADGVTGATTQTVTAPLTNCTTAGLVTMDGATCEQATVTAAFANDANGNGSTAFARGTSATGPWTSASCAAATGATRLCVDAAPPGTYYYQATFTDSDGTTGSPVVSAAPVAVTSCGGSGPITLASGTDPVGVTTVAPGGTAWLDGFALSAGSPAANVTNVQVTIPANATALASVFIHSSSACAGGTTYGSLANPSNGPNGISTSGLSISGGVLLYVCVTAKPHGGVNAALRVTGTVTGVSAAGFTLGGTDDASGTVGIDDLAPNPPSALNGTPGSGAVALTWTNPTAADLAGALVVHDTSPITWTPSDGVSYSEGMVVSGTVMAACAVPAASGAAGSCYDSRVAGGTPYYFRAFARDAYGNYSTASASLGPVTPLAFQVEGDTGLGSETPVVSILNPTSGAVLTLNPNARVQIRAFSPASRAFAGAGVELLVNGVAKTTTKSTNYSPTASSGVWEYVLGPGDNLPAGTTVTLRARATNTASATPVYSAAVRVKVAVSGAGGDGNLLRRDNSSQLCADCHALASHSSETTGTKYGSWSVTCRDCHTPHSTRNLMLVGEQITPPSLTGLEAPRTVVYTSRSGYGAGGMANPTNDGPCQVCHTRTAYYNRTGGAAHETGDCKTCHGHDKAFKGEGTCASCHLATAGSPDVDDYVYTGGGSKSWISRDEWLSLGHGRTSGTYPSGSTFANFDVQGNAAGDRGCAYCHTTGVGHGVAANFFRLTKNEADSGNVEGLNGTCLKCHGSAVYDVGALPGAGYANLTSTKKVDAAHVGWKHGGLNDDGGQFCWDCHDPHGDRTAGAQDLWYMVQRVPIANSDAGGVPAASVMAPPVNPNPVEFRASLGGGAGLDYVDYVGGGSYPAGPTVASTSGLCRNCHATSAVDHYSVGESDGHFATALGRTPNSRCTDCHKHRNGFQTQCNTCHDSPPDVGKHYAHDQVFAGNPAVVPVAYGGSTRTTATQYGIACSQCHAGTHINAANAGTSGDPYLAEVTFSGGGSYARGAVTADQGPDPLQYFGTSNGSCSATYCHSRANPLDQTGVTVTRAAVTAPTWNQAAAIGCTGCHDGGGAASVLSSAHRLHTSATAYAFDCSKCHVDTVNAGAAPTLKDRTRHVDVVKSVAFDASNPGASPYVSPTCGNVYCHSNGNPAGGPNVYGAPKWSDAVYSTCAECHGNATTLATNQHAKHLANAGTLGTNYVCASCHSTAVATGNSPITGWSTHVNGAADVSMPAVGGKANAGWDGAANTCSASWCHSSGEATPRYYQADWDVSWGAVNVCLQCHGKYASGDAAYGGWVSAHGEPNHNGSNGTPNSHRKHVNAATDCNNCHTSTSANGTTINAASALHTNGVPDVTIATNFDTNAGTSNFAAGTHQCSAVACHGAAATPTWGQTLACNVCHGAPPTSGAHAKHEGTVGPLPTAYADASRTGATKYGIACSVCHAGTHGSQTAAPPWTVEVSAGLSYSGTGVVQNVTEVNGQTYTWTTNKSCSTDCHSDGEKMLASGAYAARVRVNPTGWNATLGCGGCHGNGGAATTTLSLAHGKHVNTVASGGYAMPCSRCHADTATAAGAINRYDLHVNLARDWKFDSYLSANGVDTINNTAGTLNADHTCSNTYCHSNGQSRTAFTSTATAWTGTTTCTSCHGNTAATLTSGSHVAHLAAPNGYRCNACHATVSAPANDTTLVAGATAVHVNGDPTVVITTVYGGTYNATSKQCSNVACHGTATPTWGTPSSVTCRSCHARTGTAANEDVNSWTFATPIGAGIVSAANPMSKIDLEDWTAYGHGRTSALGNYAQSNNASAKLDGTTSGMTPTQDGCLYCHAPLSGAGAADHDTGMATNPYRLLTGSLSPRNQVCLNCHDPAVVTAWAPAGSGLATITTNSKISASHFGSKHAATGAGAFCWDCHDPHGDYRYTATAAQLAFMVQDFPTLTNSGTAGWGVPTATAANAVDFRFNLDGAGTTGVFAWGDYVVSAAPYRGVCQVCHTTTDHFRNNAWTTTPVAPHSDADANHNTGQGCMTACHKHQQPPTDAFKPAGGCGSCHLAAGPNGDVDNYVYGTAPQAMIDQTEWRTYGHAATAAFTTESNNAAPAFEATGGTATEGCYYCHAPDTALYTGGPASAHGDATNPFRLANTGGANGKNGVCLVCHLVGTTSGFDPDGGANGGYADAKNAASKVNATHYGADHTANGKGGEFCWDCHDPHGDYDSVGGRNLAYMIQRRPVRTHATAADAQSWGIPDTATELAATPQFQRATGTNAGGWDWGDYARTGNTGVCQVCHAATAKFRNTGWTAAETGHFSSGNPACTATCHTHDNATATKAFTPSADCRQCHNQSWTNIRQVYGSGDFSGRSHHVVGDTTTTEVVTNWDCVVCHAEGRPDATAATTVVISNLHNVDGNVNLVNVDSANYANWVGGSIANLTVNTDYWQFPKSASPTAPRASSSVSIAQRANLDKFCLRCHDSNGASATFNMNPSEATFRTNAGANSSKLPFGRDAMRKSATDYVTRPGASINNGVATVTYGFVLDVKSLFDPAGAFTTSGTSTWTKYSFHALRDFGSSRYGTQVIPAARWSTAATCRDGQGNAVVCNDTRQMFCSDCHRSDYNAHGTANAEYLLKCAVGGTGCTADSTDLLGTTGDASNVCYRCHDATAYSGTAHGPGSSSDYSDTTVNGTLRWRSGNSNIFGISCMNCHAGVGFGSIHGIGANNQGVGVNAASVTGTFSVNNTTRTRKAWRFMNGSSQPYYNPGGTGNDTGVPNTDNARWNEGTRTASCYTIGGATDAPVYGSCSKHTTAGKASANGMKRNLQY